jgi:hypothetical protein
LRKLTIKKSLLLVVFVGLLLLLLVSYSWLTLSVGQIKQNLAALQKVSEFQTYQNDVFAFSLRYPKSWVLETQGSSKNPTIIFSDPQNPSEELMVIVSEPRFEGVVRDSFTTGKEAEEPITVDGVSGKHLRIQNEAVPEDLVLVKTKTHLFSILGTTSRFSEILKSFKFVKN